MTIPFDEVAFKNGAVAFDSDGVISKFIQAINKDYWTVLKENSGEKTVPAQWARNTWSMKPTTSEGGQDWIKHCGGENPIPWVKPGEAEIKFRSGKVDVIREYSLDWRHLMMGGDIVEFRLTDRWLPVKGDGTIPAGIVEAKAGEFEVKYRSGAVYLSYIEPKKWVPHFDHTGVSYADIVAVRLVKKEGKPVIVGIDMATVKSRSVEVTYKDGKPVSYREIETSQQSLNRAALSRFQSSPRGKEFRAQLGHTETPPPPLGQDAIEGAIFSALCEALKK